jgi:hypothetical protein
LLSQSSIIAFFLLAGFLVYVTIKGELPKYAAILGIGSGTSTLQPLQQNAPLTMDDIFSLPEIG